MPRFEGSGRAGHSLMNCALRRVALPDFSSWLVGCNANRRQRLFGRLDDRFLSGPGQMPTRLIGRQFPGTGPLRRILDFKHEVRAAKADQHIRAALADGVQHLHRRADRTQRLHNQRLVFVGSLCHRLSRQDARGCV